MEQSVWRVDGDASLQEVLDDPMCPPLLSRVLVATGSWQVRNETTVGTTLKASRLMPQWLAALLALGAKARVEIHEGTEDVDLEAVIRRQVKDDVVHLQIPRTADTRWGEARVARTRSDEPIVAAFVTVRLGGGVVEDARLTMTGVSQEPVWLADAAQALVGEALTEQRIEDVALAVGEQAQPQDDYRGRRDYRKAVARVMARRALEACVASLAAGGGR